MSTLTIDDPVLLGFAAEIGATGPVAVAGGRTRWNHGGAVDHSARILAAPTGIVAYAAAEMTVQVRAGTPVAELEAALAAEGQRTALPDRGGTVGGAIAVGENALDVLGRGRVRDAVLQVRYVGADGELVTGGGPVVKNVTGYNLPKLMTGSLGTLGFFAEFVLRTNPIPAVSRWYTMTGVDPVAVFSALFAPSAVLWDGTTTWVHLEGHGPDLESEAAVLEGHGDVEEAAGPPVLPPHRRSLRPAEIMVGGTPEWGDFVASIGVGLVHTEHPGEASTTDPGAATVAARIKANFDPTGRCNPGRVVR